MIAAVCQSAENRRTQTLSQHRNLRRFHSIDMTNFLFDLASNLALLAIVLVACNGCNRLIPGAAIDGSRVFSALALTAMLLDAALTFLVFADSRTRYGQFSTPTAFFVRSAAYALAIVAAVAWRSFGRRNRRQIDVRQDVGHSDIALLRLSPADVKRVVRARGAAGTVLAQPRAFTYNFPRPGSIRLDSATQAPARSIASRRNQSKQVHRLGNILDFETVRVFMMTRGIDLGVKVLGAIVLWIVGRWVIGLITRLLRAVLTRNSRVDPTLAHYLGSILGALLNLLLILAILQVFGVQTTSFAALLAGLGLAIGTAWGGLLAHFAAGIFMQVLRPFKVDDFVTAGGVTGTVSELGLFGTTIVTPDNVTTIIGNNKIFSDTISNYSVLPVRRVELTAKIANGVDPTDAMNRLKAAIAEIPNVAESPAPDVEVLSFTPEGPLLCVRPYAHNEHYWQVYFDTNRAIIQTFREAGYPTPETPLAPRAVT